MKTYKVGFLVVLLFALSPVAEAQTDFVSIANAEMLLVTHNALRTSGWYPGMSGAWETTFLSRKSSQGIDVALYQIGDEVSATTIRNYIQSNGTNLRYVLIIGDADRADIDPQSPVWPLSSQAENRFVPLFGQVVASEQGYWGDIVLENDYAYVSALDQIKIGRIPAATLGEVQAYVAKCEEYFGAAGAPWTKNEAIVFDDWYRSLQNIQTGVLVGYESRYRAMTPSDWTVTTLRTTDYQDQRAPKEVAFQTAVNQGCGLIVSVGSAANMDNFDEFYYGDSPYNFTNSGMYPFVIGLNCDIGSIQRPNPGGSFNSCVIEKLLFMEHAGIIGAIAPTGSSIYRTELRLSLQAYASLFQNNVRSFGQLWEDLVQFKENPENRVPDWQFENLLLLGDPSLRYPVGVNPSGRWLASESPIRITEPLTIASGQSLTIEPGVTVIFSPGTSLTLSAGAHLIADATQQAPIQFQAVNSDPANAWRGIFLRSNDPQNLLDWCTFNNASVGIRGVEGCNATVSYCTFTNCGIAVTTSNGGHLNLTNCTVTNSRYYGVVAAGRSSIIMTNGSISGSPRAGIWAAGLANLSITGANVSVNGPINVADRNLQFGGVRNSHGSLRLRCITASNNRGPGLTVLGGFADMAPNAKNVFLNNLEVQGTRAQIYFCSTVPDLCHGRNLICSSTGGDLIQDCNGNWVSADVTKNHWCGDPTGRIPSSWTNTANDPDGAVINRCAISNDYLPCEITPSLEVFNQGWDQENSGQWDAAIASYDSVIKYWPTSKEAKLCPDRILFCDGASGKDWQTQQLYFEAVADTISDKDLQFAASAAAAWCMVEQNNFDGARAKYDSLMDHADSDYKYQKAALEALLAELKNAPWDSINSISPGQRDAPNLDAAQAEEAGDPELRVYAQIEDLLTGSRPRAEAANVPTQYELYQNYPNPFNPTTEIRFDLPENAHVELTIFNTLGQRVATVLNETKPAGTYRVQWDGSGVASGLYIYQIKAGNFTDSKKMVLMR